MFLKNHFLQRLRQKTFGTCLSFEHIFPAEVCRGKPVTRTTALNQHSHHVVGPEGAALYGQNSECVFLDLSTRCLPKGL